MKSRNASDQNKLQDQIETIKLPPTKGGWESEERPDKSGTHSLARGAFFKYTGKSWSLKP